MCVWRERESWKTLKKRRRETLIKKDVKATKDPTVDKKKKKKKIHCLIKTLKKKKKKGKLENVIQCTRGKFGF